MHSHLHHTTTGNHHLPTHTLLQPTSCYNNASLPLDQHHSCNNSFSTDHSSLPTRSFSSTSSASIKHKEAEKRRRERINSHLDRLRTILPCNSKIDKASLLLKVVERLKELKQATSRMELHDESIPSETDEITVISLENNENDGRIIIKASMCCEDRSNVLADMIQTLSSMQLSPVRVEMVAIGGRIRNIILVECDRERDDSRELVECVREALSCLIGSDLGSNKSSKRRRMMVCA
ncbi:transcription factor bHLH106-like [Bidens hawaiensis]|uniref:transcription factor bHLH106-like n=1 Tax=Bidens hawaiensis TaxID=980011 RepID=UPI00404AC812